MAEQAKAPEPPCKFSTLDLVPMPMIPNGLRRSESLFWKQPQGDLLQISHFFLRGVSGVTAKNNHGLQMGFTIHHDNFVVLIIELRYDFPSAQLTERTAHLRFQPGCFQVENAFVDSPRLPLAVPLDDCVAALQLVVHALPNHVALLRLVA